MTRGSSMLAIIFTALSHRTARQHWNPIPDSVRVLIAEVTPSVSNIFTL